VTGFCESGNEQSSETDDDFLDWMSNYRFLAKESAPWLGSCCLNILCFLYASVLCTYSITSAGLTAISQALLHCYHTPYKTPG